MERLCDYVLSHNYLATKKRTPNYIKIPVNIIEMTDEGMNEWNELLDMVKSLEMRQLQRTPSGGIKSQGANIHWAYDVRKIKSCAEITLCCQGIYSRFQFRTLPHEGISGSRAFKTFKSKCAEFGIDINDYKISNGDEVKKQIESYIIDCKPELIDKTIKGAHHIDFNSSFSAGMVKAFPEFEPVIQYFYDIKSNKSNPEQDRNIAKSVLNNTVGYMQSTMPGVWASWAHISKAAINDNNARIRNLAGLLESTGRKVIAYNTDGIWYSGEIYHDDSEGTKLGQYKNDHTNCFIRFRSKGAYEFIENGKYNVVLRGRCELDKYKPREHWTWGDIYQTGALMEYSVIDDGHIIKNNNKIGGNNNEEAFETIL